MPLVKIPFRPGIVKDDADYSEEGRWIDGDKVRFWRGRPEKVGGWRRHVAGNLSGKCRGALAWRGFRGDTILALGTHTKCYAIMGGSVLDITHEGYAAGNEYGSLGGGWGVGPWGGADGWGVPSSEGTMPRTWDFAQWGQSLLAVYPDGGLYLWDGDIENTLEAVSEAPDQINHMFVSAEKFVVLLGTKDYVNEAFDPMLVRWSDQDDYATWEPSHLTASGEYRLAVGGKIVNGTSSTGQSLIWTDEALYSMRYLYDIEFIYGFEVIGTNCGLIGPNAWAEKDGVAFWMSNQNQFYAYSGGTPRVLDCPVRKYVFDTLNRASAMQVQCGINSLFSEVWWFYPTAEGRENSRYVSYYFGDGDMSDDERWSIGEIPRTAWVDAGDGTLPVAVGPDGAVYVHEAGYSADGDSMSAYIKSAPFDIGDGDAVMNIHRIVPDAVLRGSLDITLETKRWPTDSTPEVTKTRTFTPGTDKIDIRAQGRQAQMKFASTGEGSWWRLGDLRLDLTEGGRR